MATITPLEIKSAIAAGTLEEVLLPEWEVRTPIRPLWATPDLLDRIEEEESLHTTILNGRSLYEHIWQLFSDFCCSERPGAGDLRRIVPVEDGIWKMHPPGMRIYGWCPAQHSFVAVTKALESETKSDRKLNDKKRDQVLTFIELHTLEAAVFKGEYLETFPHQQS